MTITEQLDEFAQQDRLKTREINVLVAENRMLRTALEKIRGHIGYDEHTRLLDSIEWRKELQKIALEALERKIRPSTLEESEHA